MTIIKSTIVQPQQWGTGNGYEGANPSWGEWNNGKNYFPVTFTSFYKIAVCGSYSFDNNDNTINNVSNLNYFNAQKRHSCITHYIAIGK